MRVCPKCGFIDPPQWKHVKFSYHIDCITFENFKELYPSLAANLSKGGAITEDKDYYYRLAKSSQNVMRKAKIEWTEQNPFGAEKYEKFWHGNPSQKKKDRMLEKEIEIWRKISPDQKHLFEKKV